MKSRVSAAAVIVLAMVLAGLAAPPSAHAGVFGFYGTGGLGNSDWDDSGLQNYNSDMDTRHSGGGIVLGAGSPASPIDYRISIGYEEIDHEGDSDNPDFTMHGVVIDQDLLFSLTRRQGPMRVWFGPELRLGFFNGSADDGSGADPEFFAVGLGPVLGVDLMVSPAVGLSWKVGYLYSEYFGNNDSRRDNDNNDVDVVEGHAFASLSVLFSTWGGYRDEPVPQQRQPQPRYYPRRW